MSSENNFKAQFSNVKKQILIYNITKSFKTDEMQKGS